MKNNMLEFTVLDGFQPVKYLDDVNADYLFSHQDGDDHYLMMNIEKFGHIGAEEVEKLIEKGSKVIVVEIDEYKMFTYNIGRDLAMKAHINHKHFNM